jgi:hypothetical protein
MSISRSRILAMIAALIVAAAAPAAASVSLDFLAAFNPSDDVHVILRATNGYFAPTGRDLERAAAVVAAPEEMAVVFFIARHSGASVQTILARRSRGDSWYSVMLAFGVDASVLYLDLPQEVGPPYGKAHGYRRKRGTEARPRALTDAAMIDLVGLQVAAAYYKIDPMTIVERRKLGRSYAAIHGDLYRKGQPPRREARFTERELDEPQPPMPVKPKGKGHGGGH